MLHWLVCNHTWQERLGEARNAQGLLRMSDPRNPDFRLLPGEKILWQGQPSTSLRITGRDWYLIPFSLFWGGFAVFWEASVLAQPAPGFLKFWGIPFIAIGVYLIAGRFFLDAWLRQRTRYAVTDQRIFIVRAGPFGSFISAALDRLPEIQLEEHRNGLGTLRFGPPVVAWGRNGFAAWTPVLDPTPQFLAIPDAARVFDCIQKAIRRVA
jgi:hypothetical protein